MDQFSEMQAELVARLQVASNSSLFPSARIKTLINDAYLWATSLYVWVELVRGRRTTSVASAEYYDFPVDFRSGSLFFMLVNGLEYKRKNFEDYQHYKLSGSVTTKRIFSFYGRQYFVTPIPSAGVNIDIWGAVQAAKLVQDSDQTIFSGQNSQGNEAIIKRALSVATKPTSPINRTGISAAGIETTEAQQILANLFMKQQENIQRDQRLQHPQFETLDYYNTNLLLTIPGNFSVDPEIWDE